MNHPAYETPREVSPEASVVLEANPGAWTLEGTNTWILRAPGEARCVVVDPGEDDDVHLARVAEAGLVELILLTHGHPDHADGAGRLAEVTGAPVRAADPARCLGGDPLMDGERLRVAGVGVEVLAAPGHSDDSVCLRVGDQVLTGDTILGRGTTLVTDLGAYLATLDRMLGLGAGLRVLPGHGPDGGDLRAVAHAYREHRNQRLEEVRAALDRLGEGASAAEVASVVYPDVDPALRAAAELTVAAQLAYLRAGSDRGRD